MITMIGRYTFILSVVLMVLTPTSSVSAGQPKANTCQIDEVGASEITCKGYVKLLEDTTGTATDAFQIAESRMWRAAFKFCEGIEKSHEIRNFRKESPLYSKGEVWILGGFRCASTLGVK